LFNKINNKNLNLTERQNSLIKTFKFNDKMQCFLECSKHFFCSLAIIDHSICNIYNKIEISDKNTISSLSSTIYVRESFSQIEKYLIHYWPFNGNYYDIISNANLFNGLNDQLVADRFGRGNSSLFLNYGYLQAPPAFYIYREFTVTAWVKIFNLNNAQRLLVLGITGYTLVYFNLNYGGTRGVI